MSFKISWKTHIMCLLTALLTVGLLGERTAIMFNNFFLRPFIQYPTSYVTINVFIYVILLMIPISLVHEAIHGLAYKFFGGKVKYGFKGIYSYTEEVSGLPIERTKFLIILLAPLTIMSILTLLPPFRLGG